jgi:hypothetical protein
MGSTAGNPSRVEVLLGTYLGGDPNEPGQMEFIVCLGCGYYMPRYHPGIQGWKTRHGSRCGGLRVWENRVRSPYFYVCRDPEGLSKEAFPVTSELTETELLAFSLQGLE